VSQQPNTFDKIAYIDIARENGQDIFRYQTRGNVFPIDILAARQKAKEKIFKHSEGNNKRHVFTKKGKFIYSIGADVIVQFQVLEAILDDVIEDFEKNFGTFPGEILTPGMTNGFSATLPDLIQNTVKNNVKWIFAQCYGCDKNIKIAVKKSFIKNAKRLPLPLVYIHEGHGLLVYLDADFQVRGHEIVDMSG
jgi:hypothetical protein